VQTDWRQRYYGGIYMAAGTAGPLPVGEVSATDIVSSVNTGAGIFFGIGEALSIVLARARRLAFVRALGRCSTAVGMELDARAYRRSSEGNDWEQAAQASVGLAAGVLLLSQPLITSVKISTMFGPLIGTVVFVGGVARIFIEEHVKAARRELSRTMCNTAIDFMHLKMAGAEELEPQVRSAIREKITAFETPTLWPPPGT